MASRCATCGKAATHSTPSGRSLCDTHYRELAGLAGAGTALSGGESVADAASQGYSTRAFAGAVEGDEHYQRELRAKIDAEPSFWRRLKLRIIG